MLDREHIENFLRINGVSTTAPEKEIRVILESARWHEHDIDNAIKLLKGEDIEVVAADTHSRSIFTSDQKVAPETVSSLLGLDVSISKNTMREGGGMHIQANKERYVQITCVVVGGFLLAVFFALISFYITGTGPFYSPVEQSIF